MGQAAGSITVISLLVTLSSPSLPRTMYTYFGIDMGLVHHTNSSAKATLSPQMALEGVSIASLDRPLINISHRWFYLSSAILFFVVSSFLLFVPEREYKTTAEIGMGSAYFRRKLKQSTTEEPDSKASNSQSDSSGAANSAGQRLSEHHTISPLKESDSESEDAEVPLPGQRKRRRRLGGAGIKLSIHMKLDHRRNDPDPLTPTSIAPLLSDENESQEHDRPVFSPLAIDHSSNIGTSARNFAFPKVSPTNPTPDSVVGPAPFQGAPAPDFTPTEATLTNRVSDVRSKTDAAEANGGGIAAKTRSPHNSRPLKLGLTDTYLCMWDIVRLRPMRQYIGVLLVFAVTNCMPITACFCFFFALDARDHTYLIWSF